MAEEELGKFKITFKSEGTDKVQSDLDSLRQGLRKLNEDFVKVRQEASNAAKGMTDEFGKAMRNLFGPGASPGAGNKPQPPPGGAAPANPPANPQPQPGAQPGAQPGQQPDADQDKQSKNDTKKFRFSLLQMLRGANLGGLGAAAQQLDRLGLAMFGIRDAVQKLGPWGAAISAGMAWWQKNREDYTTGRHELEMGASSWRNSLRFRTDNAQIEDLMKEWRLYNRQVDKDGNYDANATDNAAQASARAATTGLQTDLSLFNTRGRLSPWMNAMLLQNESIDGIKSVQDLEKRLRKMHSRVGDDQWRTFVAEAGLPEDIINAVVDPVSDEVKNGEHGLYSISKYSSETLRGEHQEQKGLQRGTDTRSAADIMSLLLQTGKSVRDFEKALESLGGDWKMLKQQTKEAFTIGGDKFLPKDQAALIEEYAAHSPIAQTINSAALVTAGNGMGYGFLPPVSSAHHTAQPIHIEHLEVTAPEGTDPEDFAERLKNALSAEERQLLTTTLD